MGFIKKYKKIIIGILSVFLSTAVFSSPVFAEGEAKTVLQISPAVLNLDLFPGQVYENTFVVTNAGTLPFDFGTSTSPYQVRKGDYEPLYDVRSAYTQITEWIFIESGPFHLEPGESKDLKFQIRVPMDPPAGGQYASLNAQTIQNQNDDTVSYISSIGMIIYANIAGNTRMEGSIKSQSIKGFLLTPPISANVTVENTGNVDTDASSILKVTNVFTGAEAYSNASHPQSNTILPDTYRDIDVAWEGSPFLGIFNVSLTTTFMDEVKTITKTVFICPIWLLVAVGVLLLIFIIIIVCKIRKRSKLNNRGFRFKN